jgi:hypothetical protein
LYGSGFSAGGFSFCSTLEKRSLSPFFESISEYMRMYKGGGDRGQLWEWSGRGGLVIIK